MHRQSHRLIFTVLLRLTSDFSHAQHTLAKCSYVSKTLDAGRVFQHGFLISICGGKLRWQVELQ